MEEAKQEPHARPLRQGAPQQRKHTAKSAQSSHTVGCGSAFTLSGSELTAARRRAVGARAAASESERAHLASSQQHPGSRRLTS